MDEGGSVWGFPRGLRLKEERWELRLRRNVSIKDGLKSRKDSAFRNPRNLHTMMRGGPLRLVATAGAAVTAGIFTLSMLSSVSLGAFQTVMENKRKKTGAKCGCCKGRGFVECRLCKGDSTIEWSPLYDPVVTKPCVCPTCDGNKVQKCLNCVGRGYV